MEFDSKTPIYLQIMDTIKKDILRGKLNSGQKLDSVRNMALSMKVNVNTVQRAYQELERESVTFTERGKGSFITKDTGILYHMKSQMAEKILKDFYHGMKMLGYDEEQMVSKLEGFIQEQDELIKR